MKPKLISNRIFKMPVITEDYFLGIGLSGDIKGKKGRISKVIIGPYVMVNINAAFAPAEVRSKQKSADGVISNNLLRRFNLIFDYSNKKLFIKPNSHFNEPFNKYETYENGQIHKVSSGVINGANYWCDVVLSYQNNCISW